MTRNVSSLRKDWSTSDLVLVLEIFLYPHLQAMYHFKESRDRLSSVFLKESKGSELFSDLLFLHAIF